MHRTLFPGESFLRRTMALSAADIDAIEEASGERVRNASLVGWVGDGHNVVFIDQVLGKHEFITYAVGIDAQTARVRGIEILEYRETYGDQIVDPKWRAQFVGKGLEGPLKLKKDIANISGATLSSSHVTAGVRRLVHTYDVIRSRL